MPPRKRKAAATDDADGGKDGTAAGAAAASAAPAAATTAPAKRARKASAKKKAADEDDSGAAAAAAAAAPAAAAAAPAAGKKKAKATAAAATTTATKGTRKRKAAQDDDGGDDGDDAGDGSAAGTAAAPAKKAAKAAKPKKLSKKAAAAAEAEARRAAAAATAELAEDEVDSFTPPFEDRTDADRAAEIGFHQARHGPAVEVARPRRVAKGAVPPPVGKAKLIDPPNAWGSTDFGRFLALTTDSLALDSASSTRSFSIAFHGAGDVPAVAQGELDSIAAQYKTATEAAAAAAAAADAVGAADAAAAAADDDAASAASVPANTIDILNQLASHWQKGLSLGVTTEPAARSTARLDNLEYQLLHDTWLVVDRGFAVSDTERNVHLFVCTALAKVASGDKVELRIGSKGGLSLLINDQAQSVEAPAEAKAGAAQSPPPNDELHALVSFPTTWRGAVTLTGRAGVGLSLAEQKRHKECRDRVLASMACGLAHASRLAFEAVESNNMLLLRTVVDHVPVPNAQYSCDDQSTPLDGALSQNALDMIRLLADLPSGDPFPPNTIGAATDTGTMQSSTFNHRVGKIGVARGGKEGDSAFIAWHKRDPFDTLRSSHKHHHLTAVRHGNVEPQTLRYLLHSDRRFASGVLHEYLLYAAVEAGNVQAATVLTKYAVPKSVGFTNIHVQALSNTTDASIPKLQARSVLKKATANHSITPLHMACINPANVALLKHLFQLSGSNPEEMDKNNRRLLHFAAACETADNLRFLLDSGADVMAGDKNNITPLHLAIMHNREDNVRLLIAPMKTLLQERAAASGGGKKVTAELEELSFKDKSGYAVLHRAAHIGYASTVEILLDAGCAIDVRDKDKRTPLMLAARAGNVEAVELLLARGANPDAADKKGRTALHLAATNGAFDVCQALLRKGIDPNAVDSSGHTALLYAAAYSWPAVIQLLLHYKADASLTSAWKTSALSIAVVKGNTSCVMALLALGGCDVNLKDAQGRSLLHHACRQVSDPSLLFVTELIKHKADVNAKDITEETPLLHLCRSKPHRHVAAIANKLLDAGAKTELDAGATTTPLMAALESGNTDMVELLLARGASVAGSDANTGKNILHYWLSMGTSADLTDNWEAVQKRDATQTGELLRAADKNGQTPLHAAVAKVILTKNGCPPGDDAAGDSGGGAAAAGSAKPLGAVFMSTGGDDSGSDSNSDSDGSDSDADAGDDDDANQQHHRHRHHHALTPVTLHDYDLLVALLDSCFKTFKVDINQRIELPEAERKLKEKAREEAQAASDTSNQQQQQQQDGGGQQDPAFQPPVEFDVSDGGCTLLHLAARDDRNVRLVEYLLKNNADVNAVDGEGRIPLHYAIRAGAEQCVRALVKHDASGVTLQEQRHGKNALAMALGVRPVPSFSLVKLLVEECKSPINARDHSGRTALYDTLADPCVLTGKLMEYLLDAGADTNLGNSKTGVTPLMLALLNCKRDANATLSSVKRLLAAGADLSATDKDERGLVHFAFVNPGDKPERSEKDPPASAAQQPRHGFYHNRYNQPAVTAPINRKEAIEVVSDLCALPGIEAVLDRADVHGRTPLMYAALAGDITCARYIMRRGAARLKHADVDGNTCVQLALLRRHVNFVILMMGDGQDSSTSPVDMSREIVWAEPNQNSNNNNNNNYHNNNTYNPFNPYTRYNRNNNNNNSVDMPEAPAKLLRMSTFKFVLTRNHLGLLYLLLDAGVDLSTALADALEAGKYQLALTMLEKTPAVRIRALLPDGRSLLHVLAAHQPPADVATDYHNRFATQLAKQLLDDYGLDIGLASADGSLPLHAAAQACSSSLIKLFLQRGSPSHVRQARHDGKTPVDMVFLNDQPMRAKLNRSLRLLLEGSGRLGPVGSARAVLRCLCWLREARLDQLGNPKPQGSAAGGMGGGGGGGFGVKRKMAVKAAAVPLQFVEAAATAQMDTGPDGGAAAAAAASPERTPFTGLPNYFYQMTKLVLSQKEADLDAAVGPDGTTVLMELVKLDAQESVETLLQLTGKSQHKVDINARDSQGRTAVHWCMLAGTTFCSPENLTMLDVLHRNGADLSLADANGMVPLDLAAQQASGRMYDKLKGLGAGQASLPRPGPVVEPAVPMLPAVDVLGDAGRIYSAMEEQLKKKRDAADQERRAKGPPIDPLSKLQDVGVVMEVEGSPPGTYYDLTLSRVDSSYAGRGVHLFYKMQLIENRVQNLYLLFTRWGSIGEQGQYQRTPFQERADAVAEFGKVYKSKTGQAWAGDPTAEIADPKPGKYTLMPPGGESLGELQLAALKEIQPLEMPVPAELAGRPGLISFLKTIVDRSLLLSFAGNSTQGASLPFGAAGADAIKDASQLLVEIEGLVKQHDALKGAQGFVEDKDSKTAKELSKEIQQKSEKYFLKIPLQRSRTMPLDRRNLLDAAWEEVLQMSLRNAAGEVVCAAADAHKRGTMNFWVYLTRAMDARLDEVAPDSDEWAAVRDFAFPVGADSSDSLEMEAVIRIERNGERERYAKHASADKARTLAWHGTNAANVVGILRDGLCVVPASAVQISGQAFGKGVYSSDALNKAKGYASNWSGNPNTRARHVVFVVEEAMGKTDVGTGGELRPGYNSVTVPGRRVPTGTTVVRATGARIPVGPVVDNSAEANTSGSGLTYNEFVVFDPARIRTRYAVLFKDKGHRDVPDDAIIRAAKRAGSGY